MGRQASWNGRVNHASLPSPANSQMYASNYPCNSLNSPNSTTLFPTPPLLKMVPCVAPQWGPVTLEDS